MNPLTLAGRKFALIWAEVLPGGPNVKTIKTMKESGSVICYSRKR